MPKNIDHIKRIIDTHTQRLEALEIQRARWGINAPPEITTEIDSILSERAKLQASLSALETVDTLAKEINGNDFTRGRNVDHLDETSYTQRLNIMVATIQSTVAEFSSLRNFVRSEIVELKRLIYRILLGVSVVFILWSLLFIVLSHLGYI